MRKCEEGNQENTLFFCAQTTQLGISMTDKWTSENETIDKLTEGAQLNDDYNGYLIIDLKLLKR